jgi:hypothetical protein
VGVKEVNEFPTALPGSTAINIQIVVYLQRVVLTDLEIFKVCDDPCNIPLVSRTLTMTKRSGTATSSCATGDRIITSCISTSSSGGGVAEAAVAPEEGADRLAAANAVDGVVDSARAILSSPKATELGHGERLVTACRQGDLAACIDALFAGAKPDTLTALHYAAAGTRVMQGEAGVVPAEPAERDTSGQLQPTDHLRCLKTLLLAGAKANGPQIPWRGSYWTFTHPGCSPVVAAATEGEAGAVALLLAHGVSKPASSCKRLTLKKLAANLACSVFSSPKQTLRLQWASRGLGR